MLLAIEILIFSLGFFVCKNYNINNKIVIKRKDPSNNIVYLTICFVILVFVGGFRGSFTEDYMNYVWIFQDIGTYKWKDIIFNTYGGHTELVYNLFNKIVYSISSSEILLFFLITFFQYYYL